MRNRYLNKRDLITDLTEKRPPLISLSGKSSTGKSTLADELVALGYRHIELDNIIRKHIINVFHPKDITEVWKIYKNQASKKWQDIFLNKTREEILNTLSKQPVVIDGALAENSLLRNIFEGELSNFIYISASYKSNSTFAKT